MNVLGLCSYPIEAAATRYRLIQYVEPLKNKGIELSVEPFLDSGQFKSFYKSKNFLPKAASLISPFVRRALDSFSARRYDLIFVQREAMFFGPGFFERLYQKIGKCPLILDLDDATYIKYVSPTYGKLGSSLKFFGKTDKLIKLSDAVVCGNRFIAEYVENKGKKAIVVPTVVDTDKFYPVEKNNEIPVIGWIGTHSTFPSVEALFPVLQDLAKKYDFVLKIVGAGRENIEIEGIRVENLEWNLEREISDFQSLDIGLYPLETSSSASREWLVGKSGFKAIQYMSVGAPFVVTPVGVCAEIGVEGKTHFAAANKDEWRAALEKLLQSAALRKSMGDSGRNHALENYTVPGQTEKIAKVFRESLENSGNKDKL
jgi:glycosyltransferase involved in cell wall biosynthesis